VRDRHLFVKLIDELQTTLFSSARNIEAFKSLKGPPVAIEGNIEVILCISEARLVIEAKKAMNVEDLKDTQKIPSCQLERGLLYSFVHPSSSWGI
jgi:hypothetical protein